MYLTKRAKSAREELALWNRLRIRRRLAAEFIRGEGVEIGALHQPQEVPEGAKVRYLDRLSTDELRSEYPELDALELVEVDIVEDGEDPRSIGDESIDFLIASHVIEHCEDPVGTIKNWLRVIRPGGVIFLVVPNRKRTFDRLRSPTRVDHLLTDHREGPEGSRKQHYLDWVEALEGPDVDTDARAEELMAQGYRPHFHVWSPDEFRDSLLQIAEAERLPLEIAATRQNFREFMVVIRKTPDGPT